jgi:excisionase family DNA binding protein
VEHPTKHPDILTTDEAAAFLRVDRKTLYEAIRQQQIPGVIRIGRCVRLHRDTLLTWIHGGGVLG